MFLNPIQLLLDAQRKKNAIGHFNIFNMESAKAVVSAIGKAKKPAFVAITETTIRYAGLGCIVGIVKELTKAQFNHSGSKAILHLDHGKSVETIKRAIEAGFSSVMIDGSALSLEENIELTKQVVKIAHKSEIAVEAELGHVGRVGEIIPKHYLTNPKTAEEFVEKTGVDSLAVAVGTIHGLVTKVKIDFERLRRIRQGVPVPLVIHGGTGLGDVALKDLIEAGATKINIDTALRIAFMRGLRQNITESDPRKPLTSAMDEETILVEDYIKKFDKGFK